MKEIVMSPEFEELPKSLIVEIVRSSLSQPNMALPLSLSSSQLAEPSDCELFTPWLQSLISQAHNMRTTSYIGVVFILATVMNNCWTH